MLNMPTPCRENTNINRNSGALPFGMACVFITQDGDSVYGAATVEVSLKLLCSGAVVHLVVSGRK